MAVDVEFLNGNNVNNINNNFQRVKNALQEVVGRNGNLPNHMNADLDMNGNDILNVDGIDLQHIIIDGEEFDLRQMRGWAPVFSAVEYNGTVVMKLIDYVGGQGLKPTQYIDWYVGSTGYVQDISQATGFGSSGVTDGDKGDLTVSGSGTVWTIDDEVITEPKLADEAVSTRAMADGAATLAKIGDDAKDDFRLVDPNGPRPHIRYGSATSIRLSVNSFPMGGFRYRGRYTLGRARVLPVEDSFFDFATDLAHSGTAMLENWHACFFCAKPADVVAVPKIMPYLRVNSVAGNVITLNTGGEDRGGIPRDTPSDPYPWDVNELVGAKVLVISEAGRWITERITTVTANTKTTITLDDIGGIGGVIYGAPYLDWILVAPPGYEVDEFGWAADFYLDNAEVRNIYDTGFRIGSNMGYPMETNYRTGAVAEGSKAFVNFGGNISPLATGVHFNATCSLSTASTGIFAEYFSPDSGTHTVAQWGTFKASTTSQTIVHSGGHVPFLYHQWVSYWNAGPLNTSRTNGQFNISGYDVP